MDEAVCPQCGLHNAASADVCARCRTPLEVATQVTLSPFTEATRISQSPLSSRPTAPWPAPTAAPAPQKPEPPTDPERTRILAPELAVPADARREPMFVDAARAAPPPRPPAAAPAARAPIRPAPVTERQFQDPAPQRPVPAPARLKSLMTETQAGAHMPAPHPTLAHRTEAAPSPAQPVVPRPTGHQIERVRPAQHLAALSIDAAVMLLAVCGIYAVMLAVTHHAYPSERPTAFENLAMFLAHSGHIPSRGLAIALALGLGYAGLGARRGATVGRAVMGLVLVTPEGHKPTVTAAVWHMLGCALNVMTLGAGTAWMVVDRSQRSWASLLSRTQVVLKHQVASR